MNVWILWSVVSADLPIKCLICFFLLQANLQGVHRPAHSGPLTAGKLSASPHHGARDPRLPDPLQPHHPRLRLSGHLRRHDLASELPERGAQTSGQDVPELWQRHPGILRQWEQVFRQNGQAQEMRAQRTIPMNLRTPSPIPTTPESLNLAALSAPFRTFEKKKKKKSILIDKYCHFESWNLCVSVCVCVYVCVCVLALLNLYPIFFRFFFFFFFDDFKGLFHSWLQISLCRHLRPCAGPRPATRTASF